LKPSSDNLRQSQRGRRAQFVPFCLPEEFYFYGFACPPLLRIKIKVAVLSEKKQNTKQIFFCQPNVDL
jgi:hypothetical protein